MRNQLILILLLLCAATACGPRNAAPQRPLVGVSCGRSGTSYNSLSQAYIDAITRAGGLPVIFPTVSDEAMAADLVSRVAGVVFTGGPDFDPAIYGETILNETVQIDSVRDCSDLLLARAAVASGKPILAICRGEQLMNITLGGSLYQDLPTQIGTEVSHGGTRHPITLTHDGTLYKIFGKDTLNVNSFHHQAVKVQAPGIRIMANAPDGIVEGYETDQVLAVQFHPEQLVQKDSNWLAFFRYFIGRLQ